jgi:ABC-type branched-subunit amino acid transport system substrate-binding protein
MISDDFKSISSLEEQISHFNLKIKIINRSTECTPDLVLRQFINIYHYRSSLIGVLGPACSEAIEPMAAISKHYKLPIITYSAEGISFANRENYPHFYRTIGENAQ